LRGDKAFFGCKRGRGQDRPEDDGGDIDLLTLDWHRVAAVTALTPALSCRSRRSNAPFAELVCLSKASVAEEYYTERSGNRAFTVGVLGMVETPSCVERCAADGRKSRPLGAHPQLISQKRGSERSVRIAACFF